MVTKAIRIVRKDLCKTLEGMRAKLQEEVNHDEEMTSITYADLIDMLLDAYKGHIEVLITKEGRFEGSKSLAGQIISYKVK